MKWAKAKTIFIYIFIFVNLFLFVVYRLNSFEGKQINKANVIGILKDYGITASGDVFENFSGRMKQIEAVNISADKVFLENFMGENYEIKNKVAVVNTKSFDPANGKYSDTAPDDKGFKNISEANAAGKVINYLSKNGMEKNNFCPGYVSAAKNGRLNISVLYEYDGYRLFGTSLNVVADKNGIYEINGSFLKLMQVEKRYYNVCPGESVLLDYLSLFGNKYGNGIKLEKITQGYFIPDEHNTVSSYAIPAYEFVFSNNKRICLDARENIESEYKVLLEE